MAKSKINKSIGVVDKALSEREAEFCEYIINDGLSEYEAYIKIWSVPPSHVISRTRREAKLVARRPHVYSYIQAMLMERKSSKNLDETFVTDMLKRTAIEKADTSTGVRALELLGKHLGMFKERVQIDDPGGRKATANKLFDLANRMYEGEDVETEIDKFEKKEKLDSTEDYVITDK